VAPTVADPIGLDATSFFADPTVTFGPGANDALLEEDGQKFIVVLSNDPGLGDPELPELVPLAGVLVQFTLVFTEPAGNDDEFGVFFIDPVTGLPFGVAGASFFTQTATVGSLVSLDLGALVGLLGGGYSSVGLQFQLSSLQGDGEFSSTARISGLSTIRSTQQTDPVPEPSSFALACFALALVGAHRLCRAVARRERPCGVLGATVHVSQPNTHPHPKPVANIAELRHEHEGKRRNGDSVAWARGGERTAAPGRESGARRDLGRQAARR